MKTDIATLNCNEAKADAQTDLSARCRNARFATGAVRISATWPLVLLIALQMLAAGCAHVPTVSPAQREGIYEQVGTRFERTVLVKPANTNSPAFLLAPLLVQETRSAEARARIPDVIYWWRTLAISEVGEFEQWNYLWWHPGFGDRPDTAQGVRITVDSEGTPIIWEALWDDSGARVFYVAQSVEETAMAAAPLPHPGRRFWVERTTNETPDIVVARILNDGPEPMGPIPYLKADTHDITTVICRCMEAQADEVVGTALYQLAPLDRNATKQLRRALLPGATRWLPGKPRDPLDRWLRLGATLRAPS